MKINAFMQHAIENQNSSSTAASDLNFQINFFYIFHLSIQFSAFLTFYFKLSLFSFFNIYHIKLSQLANY